MKTEKVDGYFRQDYEETCANCKKTFSLKSQEDEQPEYYTSIYLKCDCGEYIHFKLPVG